MLKNLLVFLFFAGYPTHLLAFSVSPLMSMGGELGGEKIQTISSKSVEPVSAGTGIYFSLGAKFDIAKTVPHAYEARVHLGLNGWERSGGEETVSTWTSIPLNFEYFYVNRRNQFKVGYGVTYRFSNSLDSERIGITNDFRFKDSLGYVLSIEKYKVLPNGDTSFGLRYTSIKYTEATSGQQFNGDSIGFYIVMTIDVEKTEYNNKKVQFEDIESPTPGNI